MWRKRKEKGRGPLIAGRVGLEKRKKGEEEEEKGGRRRVLISLD